MVCVKVCFVDLFVMDKRGKKEANERKKCISCSYKYDFKYSLSTYVKCTLYHVLKYRTTLYSTQTTFSTHIVIVNEKVIYANDRAIYNLDICHN